MITSPIFLYGPPGVGKTTLGRELSKSLGWEFVDLDEQIQMICGQSITAIFDSEGETGFRQHEAEALERLHPGENKVVALGGGTLLNPQLRVLVESAGKVVVLSAADSTLVDRVKSDTGSRPLIPNPDSLSELLKSRRQHYAGFLLKVEVGNSSVSESVWEIQKRAGRFMVHHGIDSYPVVIESKGISDYDGVSRSILVDRPCMIVSDENVGPIYLDALQQGMTAIGVKTNTLILPPGEETKKVRWLEYLWDGFAQSNLERGSTIIALGGGVVGDLVGFAAATYMRGLNWIYIPTSLLAMVDASIGGKTGIDRPHGKNIVGAFHPPRLVLTDPDLLKSLPLAEVRNGLAELVKSAIIGDSGLFADCLQGPDFLGIDWSYSIARAAAVKVAIVNQDPFERGPRAVLNFGHTVGHAIEHLSSYTISHGAAVAIGMAIETRLALKAGLASPETDAAILASLSALDLLTNFPEGLRFQELLDSMRIDKKTVSGTIRFSLPRAIGHVIPGVEIANLGRVFSEAISEITP